MNILFSCIGKRGYIARMFRPHLSHGDRIIGTSSTKWTSGFHSCDASFIMPSIADPAYPEAVFDLCKKERIDALLSFFDLDVHRLSKHVDALRSIGVKPFIPDHRAAEITFDKVQTCEFLLANKIPTAKTFTDLLSVSQALRNGEVQFPLYVKPRFGYGSRNTFSACDYRQLEAFYSLENDMIIQESLEGDTYDFDILNDLKGKVLSVVPWRKYLSRMGETEQAETIHSPSLISLGCRLASALGHAGPLDADLFLKDGLASILEINLRFGGGYPVSHFAGADFPGMIVRMARGEVLSPVVGDYSPGVVMMKELHVVGGPRIEFFKSTLAVQNEVNL
jgi:carbamoyl-phosphate synthase large subunit